MHFKLRHYRFATDAAPGRSRAQQSSVVDAPQTLAGSATDEPARARSQTGWWSLGLPLGLSVVAHGLIAVLIAGIAWRMAMPANEGPPATEAFIAVATPMTPAVVVERAPAPSPASAPAPSPVPSPEPAAPLPARIVVTPASAAAPPSPQATVETMTTALADAPPSIVSFAGLSAKRASSVAYVIDGSAPMVGVLPRVMAEVRASTAGLLPVQQFSVVVFRDASAEIEGQPANGAAPAPAAGTTADIFAARLLDASPRNLGRLSDWLGRIEPRGRSNPLDGLRAALALKPRPQVIFFLSRSIARSHGGQWGDGKDSILGELERLNPIDPSTKHRKTVIKALQFLEPDPTGTMQAIAEQHGGGGTAPDYRVLRVEDLPPR